MLAFIPFEPLNNSKDIGVSAGEIMSLTMLSAAYEDILSPVPVRVQHILTSLIVCIPSTPQRCYTETRNYLQSVHFQTVFAGGFELTCTCRSSPDPPPLIPACSRPMLH